MIDNWLDAFNDGEEICSDSVLYDNIANMKSTGGIKQLSVCTKSVCEQFPSCSFWCVNCFDGLMPTVVFLQGGGASPVPRTL